ncbi:hypothetical protein TUM4261_20440 [Shewanella sp. c952]|nr:hypothetical protein [Shewanella sp. c952]GIU10459.1 hypothetical protein TUM4261_20440 [Shewanella sp. c952]
MVFKAHQKANSIAVAMPAMLLAKLWEAIFEYLLYRMPKSAKQVNTGNKA